MKREEIPGYLRSRLAEFNFLVEESFIEAKNIMNCANIESRDFFVETFAIVFNRRFDEFLKKDGLFLVDLNEYKPNKSYWFDTIFNECKYCIRHGLYGVNFWHMLKDFLEPISRAYIIL